MDKISTLESGSHPVHGHIYRDTPDNELHSTSETVEQEDEFDTGVGRDEEVEEEEEYLAAGCIFVKDYAYSPEDPLHYGYFPQIEDEYDDLEEDVDTYEYYNNNNNNNNNTTTNNNDNRHAQTEYLEGNDSGLYEYDDDEEVDGELLDLDHEDEDGTGVECAAEEYSYVDEHTGNDDEINHSNDESDTSYGGQNKRQSYILPSEYIVNKRAVALYDFVSENENEMHLSEGQVVFVNYKHGQGWLVVETLDGSRTGLVPEDYLRVLDDDTVGEEEYGYDNDNEIDKDETEDVTPITDSAKRPEYLAGILDATEQQKTALKTDTFTNTSIEDKTTHELVDQQMEKLHL